MEGNEALGLYLLSRGYTPASARQRRSILTRFAAVFDVEHGDAEALLRWWASTDGLAPASRRAMLHAVSGYLAWCCRAGIRADNPAELVRAPTVPRRPPKVLTDDQVDALRAGVAGTRVALAVELMLGCGLRISEVPKCRRVADWLEVDGKGGKVAMVPLTDAAIALWPADGVVWAWSTSTLHKAVVAAMADAGITGHTAHSLRRTCATRLAQRAPLHVVAAILRHESVSTTTGHYTAVSMDDMRRAIA